MRFRPVRFCTYQGYLCMHVFLPCPLSASSKSCVCVAHTLSLLAQIVESVEKHTLGTRFCHIMFLFGP